MNSTLIAILALAALVVFVLILKKKSAQKTPHADTVEPEVSPPAAEEIAEAAADEKEADSEFEAEIEVVAEEEAFEPAEEAVVEEPQVETAVEPAVAVEVEEAAPAAAAEEEPAAVAQQVLAEISLASYEQGLIELKEQRLSALSKAIDNDEEGRREQLQIELVALTEAMSFLQQNYDLDVSCRNNALAALTRMESELAADVYERAMDSVRTGDGRDAEQVFTEIAESNGPLSAQAAYQGGCLSECRMDFHTAMERFEKAITLDGEDPDILRSAAMLARKLYRHKKALAWFGALVKLLEEQGEDTVELALARREQAYTAALVGQHKQAGALYKQAMVSLTSLVGNDDREMGICWYQIGKLQEALGQYEKAEDPYKKALAIMEKTQGNAVFGDILNKLAGLYMELEREPEAIGLLERLCTFKEQSPHPDNASLAMAYNNLAEAFRICGKYGEAEKNFRQSLAITEELRGKDHAAVGSLLQELAQLCERQKKPDEAKAYQERAAAIFQRVLEEQEAAGQESGKLNL